MAKRRISLLLKGLYWSLALAVGLLAAHDGGAQTKPKARKPATAKVAKPKPPPVRAAEHDPLTEWELVNGAGIEVREKIEKAPRDQALRQQIADLAVRSAIGAERALAIGDASLFDSYRRQFRELFHDTPWRLGLMGRQGSGAAEYTQGVVALHGYFETAAVDKACRHFDAALAKGYAGAKFRLSQCLEKDDPARASKLMRETADTGHPAASELLGRACLEAKPPQVECAHDRLTVAAASGRPSAQSALAWMYAQGLGGNPDPARAARLYLQAARAGDTAAQNNAGELYETGRGVKADPKLALEWYRKAAEAGFAPAQFNLGRLYAAGTGTLRDFPEARKWLEKSAESGIAAARKLLDWMDKEQADKPPTSK
jgi:TPR repeat protein